MQNHPSQASPDRLKNSVHQKRLNQLDATVKKQKTIIKPALFTILVLAFKKIRNPITSATTIDATMTILGSPAVNIFDLLKVQDEKITYFRG
jgi:hypothetical protein